MAGPPWRTRGAGISGTLLFPPRGRSVPPKCPGCYVFEVLDCSAEPERDTSAGHLGPYRGGRSVRLSQTASVEWHLSLTWLRNRLYVPAMLTLTNAQKQARWRARRNARAAALDGTLEEVADKLITLFGRAGARELSRVLAGRLKPIRKAEKPKLNAIGRPYQSWFDPNYKVPEGSSIARLSAPQDLFRAAVIEAEEAAWRAAHPGKALPEHLRSRSRSLMEARRLEYVQWRKRQNGQGR
jgi:hypothetical protein